jgi:hypothetical protein
METISLVQIALQGCAAVLYASWRLLRRLQRRQQGLQFDKRCRSLRIPRATPELTRLGPPTPFGRIPLHGAAIVTPEMEGIHKPLSYEDTTTPEARRSTKRTSSTSSSRASRAGTPKR